MLFTLLFDKKVLTEPGKKVISAKDFSSIKKASEILKTVKAEALVYKGDVAKECETIKEVAYREGYAEGLNKLNEIILKLNSEIEKFEEETKKKILPIALKAAKKILGEEIKLNPESIVDIVIQALKPVTEHHKIKIFVNKDDLSIIEKNKEKIKNILGQVKVLSIQERDDIEPGGCMIETEAGIINAQLENQWRALEAALEKFVK